MEYLHFDPSRFDFPKPLAPVLPTLGLNSLGTGQASGFRTILPLQSATSFVRGRYALHEAFRQAGVGPQSVVLIPAYHCRTMLDPAISLGAGVVLYGLNTDLSPDLASVAALLEKHGPRVKALLATHYFGFAQDLDLLSSICVKHGVTLVEDCAHTLFAGSEPAHGHSVPQPGQTGQFCIASPSKFFPCEDGGLLWRNGPRLTAPRAPTPRKLIDQVKGWVHTVQHVLEKSPAPAGILLNSLAAGAEIAPQKSAELGLADRQEISNGPSAAYQPGLEGLENLACSRWVMRRTDVSRLVTRRRENYRLWASAVADLANCHALRPLLPDNGVPYMFPLVLHTPHIHFLELKTRGVPIWRWDDMAVSDCKVASAYRLALLHLPCHQELDAAQMSWMIQTVATVLGQSTTHT